MSDKPNPIKSVVSSLATKALEEAIKKGQTIEILSLGIKIVGDCPSCNQSKAPSSGNCRGSKNAG